MPEPIADPPYLSHLIRLIYESAVDPALWPVFLAEYANAVGAHAVGLMVYDSQNHRGNLSGSVGFDPAWEARYAEYFSSVNVWLERGGHLLIPGRSYAGEQAVPNADLVKSEFYNDFLKPQGHFYTLGSTLIREETKGSYLTAQRSKNRGSFAGTPEALSELLLPHLTTALRLHHRIVFLEDGLLRATSALDELRNGVILTDESAKVLQANARAEALLQSADGLAVNSKGLRASSLKGTAALRTLIYETANAMMPGNAGRPGGSLSLARPSGRGALRLFISPLPSTGGQRLSQPTVAIFITAPEWHLTPAPEVFQELLELTAAEARLAVALVEGKSIQEYTYEAGVTLNTTNTHLKRIYSKLGVARQAELLRVLLSILPDTA